MAKMYKVEELETYRTLIVCECCIDIELRILGAIRTDECCHECGCTA